MSCDCTGVVAMAAARVHRSVSVPQLFGFYDICATLCGKPAEKVLFSDGGDVAWVFLCLIESDWHMLTTVAPTCG